jgi:hypothetical protein
MGRLLIDLFSLTLYILAWFQLRIPQKNFIENEIKIDRSGRFVYIVLSLDKGLRWYCL